MFVLIKIPHTKN